MGAVPALGEAGFSEVPVGELMERHTANNEQRSHQRGKIYIIKSQAGKGDKWWHNKANSEQTHARPVNGAR